MNRRFMIAIRRSPNTQGKHILTVDDINVNWIILVKILGSLRAECNTASDGQEAVEKFMVVLFRWYGPIPTDAISYIAKLVQPVILRTSLPS